MLIVRSSQAREGVKVHIAGIPRTFAIVGLQMSIAAKLLFLKVSVGDICMDGAYDCLRGQNC